MSIPAIAAWHPWSVLDLAHLFLGGRTHCEGSSDDNAFDLA